MPKAKQKVEAVVEEVKSETLEQFYENETEDSDDVVVEQVVVEVSKPKAEITFTTPNGNTRTDF